MGGHEKGSKGEDIGATIAALRWRVSELESLLAKKQQHITKLSRNEDILHATLDAASDGILAVDVHGHVLVSNRGFAKMWHIPPDLIEAADDNELLKFVVDQLTDPGQFISKVRELYHSYSPSTDILQFKDGRIFTRYSQPLVVADTLAGRVWMFRDTSPVDLNKKSNNAS